MARLDRARLDAARFACSIELPTRYADLDPQRHVSNAAADPSELRDVVVKCGCGEFNQI